jgi:hypothetical protein
MNHPAERNYNARLPNAFRGTSDTAVRGLVTIHSIAPFPLERNVVERFCPASTPPDRQSTSKVVQGGRMWSCISHTILTVIVTKEEYSSKSMRVNLKRRRSLLNEYPTTCNKIALCFGRTEPGKQPYHHHSRLPSTVSAHMWWNTFVITIFIEGPIKCMPSNCVADSYAKPADMSNVLIILYPLGSKIAGT